MARWDLTGSKPDWFSTTEQRYIVATNEGWVYENRYTTTQGNTKVHRELLVSIGGLSNTTNMGSPSITEVFLANSSGGTSIRKGDLSHAYVVFDEPLQGDPTGWHFNVANTASGNNSVATSISSTLSYANNVVDFRFTTAVKGKYKVQGQTITNTSDLLLSHNDSNESVNRLISDAVSNALGVFSVVNGVPAIREIGIANSDGGNTLRKNYPISVSVTFDEPISGDASGWTLAVANTASGNNVVGTANSTIVNYDTLYFSFQTANTGTYKVQGQTISNTNDNLYGSAPGGTSVLRLISDAVSNALGTFSIVA